MIPQVYFQYEHTSGCSLTRDVGFSNSLPRDNDTSSSYIWNYIPFWNQQHTQLKVMCYILDPFDLWDLKKYKTLMISSFVPIGKHIYSSGASNNFDTTRHCTHTNFFSYKIREISLIYYFAYFLTSWENIFFERNYRQKT